MKLIFNKDIREYEKFWSRDESKLSESEIQQKIHPDDFSCFTPSLLSKKDLMRHFYPENFSRLSGQQREGLCRVFAKQICDDYGLKRNYKVIFGNDKNVNYGGVFHPTNDKRNGTFTIAKNMMGEPSFLIGIIAHELRHAYQDEVKNGIIKGKEREKKYFLLTIVLSHLER